jgi:hypothetical protein
MPASIGAQAVSRLQGEAVPHHLAGARMRHGQRDRPGAARGQRLKRAVGVLDQPQAE